MITHPPELAWRVELEVLERAAGDSVPEALALAQARDAALRGLTALATGDRRGAEAALTRLCSAEKALARVADDAREAGALRRALAGAVAAVSTQSDPKQAAEDLASAIEEADLRVPELRSWRAQARVRGGLESREQIDEATSDLLAAGRSRALTRSERLALGRIHLHTWDVKQVNDVLSEIRTLPPELKAGLALARAQSAVNHDDPAAACEHLRGLSAGLTGYEERREAMRGAALRRAEAFLPAVERRALVDSDRRRLLDELRLARAVCPSVALPKATIDVLLAAANDARGLDFKLGAALAELAPDDYDTQSAVGILGLQKKGNKAEQAIMLVAVRRALAMAPAEDRERLVVALVQSLYYADAWKQVIAETWLHLPEVTDGIARLALFVEATAAALSLKRYDEAMKFIDLAFAVQPGHVKFRYYRAEVRFKQGRLDETYEDALAFATSGVESGSTQHAMAISWLWDYALPQGRRQPVRRAIESFLRADPRDRGGWDARAAALQLADGDLETAATSLGRAEESLRQSGKPKWMALAARTAAAAEAVTKRGLAAQAEVDATVAQLDRIRGSGHRP